MTTNERLLKAGDALIDAIRDAQARFSQAVYLINSRPAKNLTTGQRYEFFSYAYINLLNRVSKTSVTVFDSASTH